MGRDVLRDLIQVSGWQKDRRGGHRFATSNGRPLGDPFYPLNCHPCYSPDGRLVAACRTQTVKDGSYQSMLVAAWDRQSGRPVLPWTPVSRFIHSLAFSPDGQTLAVGAMHGISLLDIAARRRPMFITQRGPIARLEFSPDGRRLAAGARSGWPSPPGVQLWDLATFQTAGPLVSTGRLPAFQFTPAGDELVVVDTASRRVTRINPIDGGTVARAVALPGQDAEDPSGDRPEASPLSLAIAFRPDCAEIVESPSSSQARQYDVRTGRPIGPPMDHRDTIGWLAYSPDGATLASACPDGTVRLWDARCSRAIGPALVLGLPAIGLFFSPDGTSLNAVTIDGRATSWPVPRPVAVDDPERLRL